MKNINRKQTNKNQQTPEKKRKYSSTKTLFKNRQEKIKKPIKHKNRKNNYKKYIYDNNKKCLIYV